MSVSSNPIHGNYRGYYTKRQFLADPRLALLDASFFKGKTVLDVGCNEGFVTCEIAQKWGAKIVLGVDIDEYLVQAAWKRRKTIWSLQAPNSDLSKGPQLDGPTIKKRKIREGNDGASENAGPDLNHFPLAFSHMFGPLSIPSEAVSPGFPHNVSFHTADWVKSGAPKDAERYDIVIAFSITKWIHLNDGDAGIETFFRRVHSVLVPGGHLILEPQTWDTYTKAKRMCPELKGNGHQLQLKPGGFTELLGSIELHHHERLGVVGEGGFQRPVDIFVKG